MSSGLSLEFYERKPGEWYYIIEEESAPRNAWDWHDFAELVGPFESLRGAQEHNQTHYRNTGHETHIPHENYTGEIEKRLQEAIAPNAQRFQRTIRVTPMLRR